MNGMGMGTMSPTTKKRYLHMTFFWGKNSEILFTGWPGTSAGMYALALIFMFVLGFLVEWLSGCRLLESGGSRKNAAAGFAQPLLHTVRVSLAYLVMLALMSFNGGVLLAIVGGHAFGFLFFRSRVFKNSYDALFCEEGTDLPQECCS